MTRTLTKLSLAGVALALLATGALAQRKPREPVTVPIQVFNNHVFVRMQYEVQDLWMLLDTGAGLTLLDMAVVERLKIKTAGEANIGGAGPAVVRGAQLKGIKLVLPEDKGMVVSPRIAMPMVGLNSFEGRPVNGILGADFIEQSVLEIDYADSQLRLHDRKSFRYAGPSARLPLTFVENQPHTVGQVLLGDGSRLKADCHVDVGSSGALILTKPFVEKNNLMQRVTPTVRRRSGGGAGGPVTGSIGRVAGLQFGDSVVKAPITAMYGDSAGVFSTDRFECNIGGEILRRYSVFFDYGRKSMYVEPNSTFRDAFESDMSGATFRADSAGFRVFDVLPNGPAGSAGLKQGDLVVAVEGEPALTFGVEALRKRMRQDGTEVQVLVRRAGGDVMIRIPLRRLI